MFITLVATSLVSSSCGNSNRKEKEEPINETTEMSSSPKQQTNRKPTITLDYNTASVQTAGAGFRYAEAYISIDYIQERNVSALVTAYANGKKVGSTLITIEAGESSSYSSFRLDGFYGMFEDRIPSTVTLKITSVD